jgi:chemotaxis protein methyltransferase CheR
LAGWDWLHASAIPQHKGCEPMIQITELEFMKLSGYIQTHYGIQLKKEKHTLLTGRLHKLVSDLGFKTFSEYYDYLIQDTNGHAAAILIDKISTNHTFFMREANHFYYFRDVILPELKRTVTTRDLRIWCAASSTGEEPYTLAMILKDYFGAEVPGWDTKVLATDISQAALDTAKKGIYPIDRVSPLPQAWIIRYFQKTEGDQSMVREILKREVIFRRFNLMDSNFPFKRKFHVIFCRNVMIYFDQKTKDDLVNKLYDLLEDGGYLFIGHSESLNRETTNFRYIKPAVYRKLP